MRIAITGGSGFVGQHVLSCLVAQGAEVAATTRDTTRLARWKDSVRIVKLDLATPPEDTFEQLGFPDVLIHLAWEGLPNYKSLFHFEKELPRQYHFLKIMVEAGLKSMFVAGTCLEYGMQSGELSETIVLHKKTPYGFSKDALRQQLEFLKQSHAFTLKWGRLFYMYGKGQPQTSLYAMLKQAATEGKKEFDMTGGEQLRDYLPVEEVARYIVTVSLNNCAKGIINICSGKPVSIRCLAEQWVNSNNWKIKLSLRKLPYSDHEPMAFWGNRRRLDRLTKIFPTSNNQHGSLLSNKHVI